MNPETEKRIAQLEYSMAMHQHRGVDSAFLRHQDWQQIGQLVLPAAATSISVTIPAKRFLKVILSWGAKSGASNDLLRFNSDSGANYTTTTGVSQTEIDIKNAANSILGGFSIIEIANNLSSIVKPVFIHTVNRITGAGTAIGSYQLFACWVNTAAFITTIALSSSNTETYPANSILTVLSSKE